MILLHFLVMVTTQLNPEFLKTLPLPFFCLSFLFLSFSHIMFQLNGITMLLGQKRRFLLTQANIVFRGFCLVWYGDKGEGDWMAWRVSNGTGISIW